jgi:hypothetical protein
LKNDVFQIDANVTLFLGGIHSKKQILKFDWITEDYFKYNSTLISERWYSSCALLRDQHRSPVVVVVNGRGSSSFEIWNPDKDVNVLTNDLPNVCLYHGQLVVVSDRAEFLIYGGLCNKTETTVK